MAFWRLSRLNEKIEGSLACAAYRPLIQMHQAFMILRMNREFHYYVVCYLARKAGFSPDQAETIALSSQMVDDSKLPWKIEDEQNTRHALSARQSTGFVTEVTQNYLFWNHEIARDVYLPFHFIPGDPQLAAIKRKDRKLHPLAVTADSQNARSLLIEALRSRNLFRIGIALHSYADTWAHQNFTGTIDPFNELEAHTILPPVGHLQAGTTPDEPQALWKDTRLAPDYEDISNSARFLEAARMIYRFLSTAQHRKFDDEAFVIGPLEELWINRRTPKNDSLAAASDYVIYFEVPPYDPDKWLKPLGARQFDTRELLKAITTEGFGKEWLSAFSSQSMVRGVISISKYRDSMFAQWNIAASAHRNAFIQLMHAKGIQVL